MIKIKTFFIFVFTITSVLSAHQNLNWQQDVHYIIEVELEPQKKLLRGIETIVYTNNSPDTLNHLYFHLYPNAFNDTSLMAKEMSENRLELIQSPDNIGYMKVMDIYVTSGYQFDRDQLITDYEITDTILKINLSQSLLPNQQLIIKMNFEVKIRAFNSAGGKGGYVGEHYVVSQWYPKICVYDEHRWNIMPYFWLGEFYGEFGKYEVTINTPFNYIIGATGEVIDGDPGWQVVQVDSSFSDSQWNQKIDDIASYFNQPENQTAKRSAAFYAENVHDFVWCASPNFVCEYGSAGDVPVFILYNSINRESWSGDVLKISAESLHWLNAYIGKFPYPQLSILQGVGHSGMEYPMVGLIGIPTANSIFHEITHNYFYAAVANNEQLEGWLDEGLVTYITAMYLNDDSTAAVSEISFLDKQYLPVTNEHVRLNYLYYYLYSDQETPIAISGYKCKNQVHYSLNFYVKGAHFFNMLHYVVGDKMFQDILQHYYQKWSFKHVNEQRFQSVCEQIYGKDLDWFFNEWLYQTPNIDYAIGRIKKFQRPDGKWVTKANVKKLGNGIMPVEVALYTENDSVFTKRIDGVNKTESVNFLTASRPQKLLLDPRDKILDQFRLNNSSSSLKVILYPDYPNLYYQPRDQYLISVWPRFWYNDIDGFKFGTKFFGGYLNRFYINRVFLWYGFKSQQFDLKWSLTHPCKWLGQNSWFNLVYARMEGRLCRNINIHFINRKYLFGLPVNNLRLGFADYRLYDQNYINYQNIVDWDDSKIGKFFIHYDYKSKRNLCNYRYELNFEAANKRWGSDADFLKLYGNYNIKYIFRTIPFTLYLQTFAGVSFLDDSLMPIQENYFLAEGNPLQRFNEFYLRSQNPLLEKITYYFPGDGNLRGYTAKSPENQLPLAANNMLSFNVEFSYRKFDTLIPILGKYLLQQQASISCEFFFDIGLIDCEEIATKWLADAGFGFTMSKLRFHKERNLRFNFPIWLSHPNINNGLAEQDNFRFRWLISFESAL